jgi:xanthine dehydrogenase YagS FAD-binding subunit
VYLKSMDRAVWAFATVSVAAALRLNGRLVEGAALVLGGVAAVPWRVAAVQALQGTQPDEAAIAAFARDALDRAEPLRMNAYKVPLAEALIRRALQTLVT